MTLDEEIKHYEEMAESAERSTKLCPRPDKDVKGSGRKYLKYLEYAKTHRRIAEWLKELKAYRKAKKKIIENMKAWEKIYHEPLEWNVEDINSIKLAFYQDGKADAYTDCIGICEIAFEEVTADGNSN